MHVKISQRFSSLEANAGALTNFEVLEFLRSKGAESDSTRVLAKVAPSEYKVYDYLAQTPACKQTRENISEFLERCKKYDLAKAEMLNIINVRPSSAVEIYPIIEECENRFGDAIEELVELVENVLPPPPPTQPETIAEGKEETAITKQSNEGMDVVNE
ncbi:DNA-directed RNA polymerase III subunit rpc9 [Morella rubra]|uniref:DNA-directed RNA polymerase III subunit RPC9 n=1 Tax=Morella rubra TaxID=262757 RepID=A0A6A1W2W9_9ROSI|nr:DNA-directed RNA polymerase III subunit rpc9 [Morella rubra]